MGLSFELRDGIGIFSSSGDVEYDEGMQVFRSGLEELARSEHAPARMLFDLLESTESRSQAELRAIVDVAKQHLPGGRMALAAQSDLLFGLSRMFGIHAEQAGFEAAVFKSRDEAIAWLGLPGTPP
jgi:hypothetical protein